MSGSATLCLGCRNAMPPATSHAVGFRVEVGGRGFIQPDYQVAECAVCGLFCKSPIWPPDEERDYYRLLAHDKWEWPTLFPTERAAIAVTKRLVPAGRILDFGCSTGRLLAALDGPYERFGVEVNEHAARVAASRGITMLAFDELEGVAGGFDAIVLCDVIEHIRQPVDLLDSLDRYLKPGGLLLLVTGNADCEACRRDRAGFWYLRNIEHVSMAGARFCQYLVERFGYRMEEWREESHYDMKPAKRVAQRMRDFAYWTFRRGGWRATALRWVPVLNRAMDWPAPPALECTPDHIVVAFRKQGSGT